MALTNANASPGGYGTLSIATRASIVHGKRGGHDASTHPGDRLRNRHQHCRREREFRAAGFVPKPTTAGAEQ